MSLEAQTQREFNYENTYRSIHRACEGLCNQATILNMLWESGQPEKIPRKLQQIMDNCQNIYDSAQQAMNALRLGLEPKE